MLAFNNFNPYAVLAGQTRGAAKVAKDAKDQSTLASLAALAWDAADWHAYYNERAAIAEYEGGLSRSKAEKQAFACCVTRWLRDNGNSHLWLHGKYRNDSLKRMRQQAVKALARMGVNCN